MRNLTTVALIVSLAVAAAGCSSPTAPNAITYFPPLPSPTPLPPPSPPTAAAVVIEDAWAGVRWPNDLDKSFGFGPRFLLRETGGKSGATLLRIVVSGPNGTDETDPGCWGPTLRVPPGGTLDTFYTDAGFKWLLYCAPGTGGSHMVSQVGLSVTFADDEGRVGVVGAVVPVRE